MNGVLFPINLSILTVGSVNPEPLKVNDLFTSNGVTMTLDVNSCLYAIIYVYQKSSLILTSASFVKFLSNGLDNLATASNSLVSLYNPIVVMYVCGLLIK